MKTAIATLLSAVAVTTVSNGAGAERFNVVLNTSTYLGEMNAIIVNDAIAPIYTPVTSNENNRQNDDGNNDNVNEAGTFGFTPVLAAADTTFSTLSGASIGLAQDQTAGVNTGVTFNKDSSNQNHNDNQPSEGSNIGVTVKSYDGITIQPYEPELDRFDCRKA